VIKKRERGTSKKKKNSPSEIFDLDPNQKKTTKKGGPGPDHLAHQAQQTAVPGPRGHLGRREQRPRDRFRWGWRERALEEGEERR